MPLQNGRNVNTRPGRSKSTSSAAKAKLPPVISQETRERAEAVKKALDRPKTAHRSSRPPTSTHALPSFGNGRLPTASKKIKLEMKRSNSETRPLPKIEYGRSPSREKLTDLRDELFQAKKKVASYETDLKKLNTEMQRLRRDAEKRESFLERIVTAQYHPTELNDTHLARTLTSIKKKEIAKENLIDIQAKELERLRYLLKESSAPLKSKPRTNKTSQAAKSESDVEDEDDDSDYPEEPEQMETNGISKREHNIDEVFEEDIVKNADKSRAKTASRERNELAKKYAEQNAMLKQKLKEVKQNYVSMMEKNKKKGEEFIRQSEKSKAVVEKTVEIGATLSNLQKEREDLSRIRKKNEEQIGDLSQELIEAYGEIDALKMHNEKLQENLRELKTQLGNLHIQTDFQSQPPQLNIPRLNMADIDDDENLTSNELSDGSIPSIVSEFNHDHLADALANRDSRTCFPLFLLLPSVISSTSSRHVLSITCLESIIFIVITLNTDDNLKIEHMSSNNDYNIKSSSGYHHSEFCTKLNYIYTSRQCEEYISYIDELRRIIFGNSRFPEYISTGATCSPNGNSIHYHKRNGKTLVYEMRNTADYGIELSPIKSETEIIVTKTYSAEQHALIRPETSEIIPPKLCHFSSTGTEETMHSCLYISSDVINRFHSNAEKLLSKAKCSKTHNVGTHSTNRCAPHYQNKYEEFDNRIRYASIEDLSDNDKDFRDADSISDMVDENFAVHEQFAKILEETDSVFEELGVDTNDDDYYILDDKINQIFGIDNRQFEQSEPLDTSENGKQYENKKSSDLQSDVTFPVVQEALSDSCEDLLSVLTKVKPSEHPDWENAYSWQKPYLFQLPSIFSNRSLSSPNVAPEYGINANLSQTATNQVCSYKKQNCSLSTVVPNTQLGENSSERFTGSDSVLNALSSLDSEPVLETCIVGSIIQDNLKMETEPSREFNQPYGEPSASDFENNYELTRTNQLGIEYNQACLRKIKEKKNGDTDGSESRKIETFECDPGFNDDEKTIIIEEKLLPVVLQMNAMETDYKINSNEINFGQESQLIEAENSNEATGRLEMFLDEQMSDEEDPLESLGKIAPRKSLVKKWKSATLMRETGVDSSDDTKQPTTSVFEITSVSSFENQNGSGDKRNNRYDVSHDLKSSEPVDQAIFIDINVNHLNKIPTAIIFETDQSMRISQSPETIESDNQVINEDQDAHDYLGTFPAEVKNQKPILDEMKTLNSFSFEALSTSTINLDDNKGKWNFQFTASSSSQYDNENEEEIAFVIESMLRKLIYSLEQEDKPKVSMGIDLDITMSSEVNVPVSTITEAFVTVSPEEHQDPDIRQIINQLLDNVDNCHQNLSLSSDVFESGIFGHIFDESTATLESIDSGDDEIKAIVNSIIDMVLRSLENVHVDRDISDSQFECTQRPAVFLPCSSTAYAPSKTTELVACQTSKTEEETICDISMTNFVFESLDNTNGSDLYLLPIVDPETSEHVEMQFVFPEEADLTKPNRISDDKEPSISKFAESSGMIHTKSFEVAEKNGKAQNDVFLFSDADHRENCDVIENCESPRENDLKNFSSHTFQCSHETLCSTSPCDIFRQHKEVENNDAENEQMLESSIISETLNTNFEDSEDAVPQKENPSATITEIPDEKESSSVDLQNIDEQAKSEVVGQVCHSEEFCHGTEHVDFEGNVKTNNYPEESDTARYYESGDPEIYEISLKEMAVASTCLMTGNNISENEDCSFKCIVATELGLDKERKLSYEANDKECLNDYCQGSMNEIMNSAEPIHKEERNESSVSKEFHAGRRNVDSGPVEEPTSSCNNKLTKPMEEMYIDLECSSSIDGNSYASQPSSDDFGSKNDSGLGDLSNIALQASQFNDWSQILTDEMSSKNSDIQSRDVEDVINRKTSETSILQFSNEDETFRIDLEAFAYELAIESVANALIDASSYFSNSVSSSVGVAVLPGNSNCQRNSIESSAENDSTYHTNSEQLIEALNEVDRSSLNTANDVSFPISDVSISIRECGENFEGVIQPDSIFHSESEANNIFQLTSQVISHDESFDSKNKCVGGLLIDQNAPANAITKIHNQSDCTSAQTEEVDESSVTHPAPIFSEGLDFIPESSNCSVCAEPYENVSISGALEAYRADSTHVESKSKSLQQPLTSLAVEEASYLLTTACVTALAFMSPSESGASAIFNSDIIENASKYISSESSESKLKKSDEDNQ